MAREVEILVSARDKASEVFQGIQETGSSALQSLEDNFEKFAIAGGVAGGALEALNRKVSSTNETISRLSTFTGDAEDDIRDMATEISDATLPVEDAIEGFETLYQRGVDNTEAMRDLTEEFDAISDATGEDLNPLIERGSELLSAFGSDVTEVGEYSDALTHILTSTSIELSDFNRLAQRGGEDLRQLGMEMDEGIAVMLALEERYGSGRTAMREFQQASTEAQGDQEAFMEILGLTESELRQYSEEVEGASGLTEELADIHADSYTPIERLMSVVGDLQVQYGEQIQVIGQLSPLLMGLAPALRGIQLAYRGITGVAPVVLSSMQRLIGVVRRLATAKIALGAPVWAVVGAITAFGALAYVVYKNWEESKNLIGATWEWIRAQAENLRITVATAFTRLRGAVITAISAIIERLAVLEGLPFGLGESFEGLRDSVGDMRSGVSDDLDELADDAEKNEQRIQGATEDLSGSWADMATAVSGDVEDVAETVRETTGRIKGEYDELEEEYKEHEEEMTETKDEEASRRIDIDSDYWSAVNQYYLEEKERREQEKEELEILLEERETFEQSWTRRLQEQVLSRLELLELEKEEALQEAEELGADKEAIHEYYNNRILDELIDSNIDTLDELEDWKDEAIEKAEEYGVDKSEIISHYAQLEGEIMAREAEEKLRKEEQTQKELLRERENFEERWTRRMQQQTETRLETIEREKEEALEEAEELGAEKHSILAYYEDLILDEILDTNADSLEDLKDWKRDSLSIAEDHGIDKLEILEKYADLEEEFRDDEFDAWSEWAEDLNDVVSDEFDTMFRRIIEGGFKLEDVWDALRGFVSGVWSDIAGAISSSITDMLSDQIQWVAETLANIGKLVAGYISQAYSALVAYFSWAGPFAPVMAGGVIATAIGSIAYLGRKAVSAIGDIVGLEEGGLVSGPILAMVGEGRDDEAVIPLNKQVYGQLGGEIADVMRSRPEYRDNSQANSINVSVNIDRVERNVDINEIGDKIVRRIRTKTGIKL